MMIFVFYLGSGYGKLSNSFCIYNSITIVFRTNGINIDMYFHKYGMSFTIREFTALNN